MKSSRRLSMLECGSRKRCVCASIYVTSLVRRNAVARAASANESSPSSMVLISHVVSTPDVAAQHTRWTVRWCDHIMLKAGLTSANRCCCDGRKKPCVPDSLTLFLQCQLQHRLRRLYHVHTGTGFIFLASVLNCRGMTSSMLSWRRAA